MPVTGNAFDWKTSPSGLIIPTQIAETIGGNPVIGVTWEIGVDNATVESDGGTPAKLRVKPGGINTTQLANAGPGATGPVGDATHVPVVTIDAKGRVTALSSVAITAGSDPSADTLVWMPTTTTTSVETAWFPLFDSDGSLVLDADGNIIPTMLTFTGVSHNELVYDDSDSLIPTLVPAS